VNTDPLALVAPDPESQSRPILELLRQDIVAGVFKAGERLKLAELAARYSAGYAPTREALHHLCGEGWVEIDANRGAPVANISLRRVLELFDVRSALEPHVAVRFVAACSNLMLDRLEALEQAFEDAAAAGRHSVLVTINHTIHDFVSVNAGNDEATRLLRQNSLVMQSVRRLIGHTSARLDVIIDEHRSLLAAFRRRDETAVAAISKTHLLGAAKDFEDRYRLYAEVRGFDPDAS